MRRRTVQTTRRGTLHNFNRNKRKERHFAYTQRVERGEGEATCDESVPAENGAKAKA